MASARWNLVTRVGQAVGPDAPISALDQRRFFLHPEVAGALTQLRGAVARGQSEPILRALYANLAAAVRRRFDTTIPSFEAAAEGALEEAGLPAFTRRPGSGTLVLRGGQPVATARCVFLPYGAVPPGALRGCVLFPPFSFDRGVSQGQVKRGSRVVPEGATVAVLSDEIPVAFPSIIVNSRPYAWIDPARRAVRRVRYAGRSVDPTTGRALNDPFEGYADADALDLGEIT